MRPNEREKRGGKKRQISLQYIQTRIIMRQKSKSTKFSFNQCAAWLFCAATGIQRWHDNKQAEEGREEKRKLIKTTLSGSQCRSMCKVTSEYTGLYWNECIPRGVRITMAQHNEDGGWMLRACCLCLRLHWNENTPRQREQQRTREIDKHKLEK